MLCHPSRILVWLTMRSWPPVYAKTSERQRSTSGVAVAKYTVAAISTITDHLSLAGGAEGTSDYANGMGLWSQRRSGTPASS